MRPEWNSYFSTITSDVAARSTCIRRQVGAIIVKDKRILTTGYNGVPTGIEHCTAKSCLRAIHKVPSGERHELCRGLHAEQNAIIQAAMHGVSIQGSDIYVTHHPCSICAKMIINSGIVKVYYHGEYNDPVAGEMFIEAGISVTRL
jgi:dCMP deaminase